MFIKRVPVGMRDVLSGFVAPLSSEASRIYGLTGSSKATFLALSEFPFVAVEPTEEDAEKLWRDIRFYRALFHVGGEGVCFLPEADGPGRAGMRAEAVTALSGQADVTSCTTSEEALSEDVWSPADLDARFLSVTVNQEVARDFLERKLVELGYARFPLVAEQGQYSLRGYILDVFPSTASTPFRAEFFGDTVESIRLFDLESQRSVRDVSEFRVLPAQEPDEGIRPLALLEGRRMYFDETVHAGAPEGAVMLSRFSIAGKGSDARLLSLSGLGVLYEERRDLYALPRVVADISREHRVVLVASSEGQAERLKEVFSEKDVILPAVPLEEVFGYRGRSCICAGALSSGLFLPGLLILTEKEIFGGRPAFRPMKPSKVSGLLARVDDLTPGDYVVHSDRGVGRFEGLVHERVEGYEYDMLALTYAEDDRLYIPLHAIDKVHKFHAEEGVSPQLDSLRTKRWQKTKERVRKRIHDMARRLVKLYAEREVSDGFAFSLDTEVHREFESFFPYEETRDQAQSIAEIKRDMESRRPAERLLCGDAGYGKTEVAMRAAFKAVYDGKQVAVLVPTTLLCEQHLRIFQKRFSAFPVEIEGLSRFKSRRENLETLEKLRAGRIDIIIGTHALLRKDISFSDLGLLVIDEEHRFGVRQKERIKELRKGVDVLSLSATPIPRTLQMSLSGIRKMSVIETPPEERVAVKSTVSVWRDDLVRHAVEKELERGGQVFFVHNRIKDIERVHRKLGRLLPLARIAIAHGQMREHELEQVMLSFLNGEIDVLLSTAIIGSGLDIPTANTIIINLAHQMGLADLYQLKGRVGRSNVRAYAYSLVPEEGSVTEEARRRLQAIQEMSYMGAGFRLAMRDLAIRGAGNLLGPQQSGCINAVGFDLYVELLEEAVAELRGVERKERVRPLIDIKVNAFVPEDYIGDMTLRLSVYRSLSSASDELAIEQIREEMTDRFGRPPGEFVSLLELRKLSLLAEELGIREIRRQNTGTRFVLSGQTSLKPERLREVLKGSVKFLESGFEVPLGGGYEDIRELLSRLLEDPESAS
jgi:transcription-repair coupling factor (superfamily II helicase)